MIARELSALSQGICHTPGAWYFAGKALKQVDDFIRAQKLRYCRDTQMTVLREFIGSREYEQFQMPMENMSPARTTLQIPRRAA